MKQGGRTCILLFKVKRLNVYQHSPYSFYYMEKISFTYKGLFLSLINHQIQLKLNLQ